MEQRTKHLTVIDMIKGMTILLVVAGHAGLPADANSLLSAVRMPLFFIVSGYVFSSTKYFGSIHVLLKTRLLSIVLPYFSAGLLFYAFWALRQYADSSWNMPWYEPLVSVFYGTHNAGLLEVNVSLWFLTCLFAAQLVFCLVMGAVRKMSAVVQSLLFAGIGLLGGWLGGVASLPWGVDIALVAQVFLFIGFKLKEARLIEKVKPISWPTAVLAVIFIPSAIWNSPVDMGLRHYNHIPLFLICGITGGLLVIQLVRLFERFGGFVKLLALTGRESLAILIYHGGFFLTVIHLLESRILHFAVPWYVNLALATAGSLLANAIVKKIPVLNFLLNGKRVSKKQKSEMSNPSPMREVKAG